jgi:hypothetical protein
MAEESASPRCPSRRKSNIQTLTPIKIEKGDIQVKGKLSLIAIVLISVISLTLMVRTFPIMLQKQVSSNEASVQISDLRKLVNATDNQVYFMYSASGASDMLAAQVFYDACAHPSEVFYQTGDQNVDNMGCPRPEVFGPGKYLVFFGGPLVQPAVKYYEESGQVPVAITLINSTDMAWISRQGGEVNRNIVNLMEFDPHHDMFVLEFFVDTYGRNVFICYGWSWQGTSAGAKYLVEIMLPIIDQYTSQFYIFRWVDTNNDYVTEANEVFEQKEKFVSVQAFLHWGASPETVVWFANACHSRNLTVTWYVDPEYNSNLTSLLKGYTNSGDDVELSFGAVFFNKLTPEERLATINQRLAEFKVQFGFYPSLVEAYYIDAFSLNYVASQFSFIIGAVGYVNHEVSVDGLRTAGAYYMPYYPSKLNTLVPGTGENKIPLVILPFIQRDISNSILYQDVRYNLCPQDGSLVVNDWTIYFRNLLDAYLNGWDQFGLAFYPVDLTFNPCPRELIEADLEFIHGQIQSQNCTGILDKTFTEWFRARFADSPCYRWVYDDPNGQGFSSTWYFNYEERAGQVVDHFSEIRSLVSNTEEGCYYKQVYPYDNSFSLSS